MFIRPIGFDWGTCCILSRQLLPTFFCFHTLRKVETLALQSIIILNAQSWMHFPDRYSGTPPRPTPPRPRRAIEMSINCLPLRHSDKNQREKRNLRAYWWNSLWTIKVSDGEAIENWRWLHWPWSSQLSARRSSKSSIPGTVCIYRIAFNLIRHEPKLQSGA